MVLLGLRLYHDIENFFQFLASTCFGCFSALRHVKYEVHDDIAVLRMDTPNEKASTEL